MTRVHRIASLFFAAISGLFLPLSTPLAQAEVACFAPSPRFTQQGDQYWLINTLSTAGLAGKKQLLRSAEPLNGRVEGSLYHQECSGSESKPLVRANKASVKGTLSVDAEGIKLNLEVTDLKEKTIKQERMEFLGRSPTVAFSVAEGEFSLVQKLRANANPGDKISLLRESQYSLIFTKNHLKLRAVHFANGLTYAEDIWEISPR